MIEDLLRQLLKPPEKPRSPIVEAIITGEVIAERLKEVQAPPQPDLSQFPQLELPTLPKLEIEKIPEKITHTKTHFLEHVSLSKNQETIFAIQGSGLLVNFVLHSEDNDYSIIIRRDGSTLFFSRFLTHTEWTEVSTALTKINAYQEVSDDYMWGAYDIHFGRSLKVIVKPGTTKTFKRVMATYEIVEWGVR